MIHNLRTQKEFEEVYTELGSLRANIPCKVLKVFPHYYGTEFYVDICAVMGLRVTFSSYAGASGVTSKFVDDLTKRLANLPVGTYKFFLTDTIHGIPQTSKSRAREIILGHTPGMGNFRVLPVDCLVGDRIGFREDVNNVFTDESYFWKEPMREATTHAELKEAIKATQAEGYPGAIVDVRGARFLFASLKEERWTIVGLEDSKKWGHSVDKLILENKNYPGCQALVTRAITRIDASDIYHNKERYMGSEVIIQHEGRCSKCPTKIKNVRLKALNVGTAPASLIV